MAKIKPKQISDLNTANGLVQLNGSGTIPNELLPPGLSGVYMDKQIHYVGELFLLESSQYWRVLDDIYLNEIRFDIESTPTGSGQTVAKLIKNNDLNSVLYTATFTAGDYSYTNTNNVAISYGDKISLAITETTSGFHGSDLTVSIKYAKTQD